MLIAGSMLKMKIKQDFVVKDAIKDIMKKGAQNDTTKMFAQTVENNM